MEILAGTLGCQIGSLPFTYLGLPLGTTKPKIEEFAPLIDRVERRLTACSSFLSYSGHVEYINTILTPIVTYAMCTFKLHKGVIHDIDRIRKQCLWRGNSERKRGGNLVAWPLAQRPKKKGGLGIKNLSLQNDAPLLKQLHKFYSKSDIPWVHMLWFKYYASKVQHIQREVGSFWWKDIFRLKDLYGFITTCQLGDGSSILFWKDNWAGECLDEFLPNIAQFARFPDMSVKDVSEATCLEDLFVLPISQLAARELDGLRELVHAFVLSDDPDQRIFCWGSNRYAATKLYKLAFLSMPASACFRLLWKSKVTPRVKFFAWLIFMDRLNTKSMLARRNFNVQPNCHCVLCAEGVEETIEHLFFDCVFARQCWDKLGIVWDPDHDIHRKIIRTREQAGSSLFIELFLIASWELWKVRNRLVFYGVQATFCRWLRNFKEEASLQANHLRDDDRRLVCLWLDAL